MKRLARRGLPHRRSTWLTSLATAIACAACMALPAGAGAASPHMAGAMSHVLWANVDTEEMDRQLDRLKELGAGITRVDVGWSSIEHEAKGKYESWYMDRLDHLVEGANERGIKLLLLFAETPCWASTAPESLKQGCTGAYWQREVPDYPPRDMSDYGDALAFLVKRYGDKVYSYEIWNEPNQEYFFHTDDPVGDYAKMVKAGYRAAKAADPRPIIVAGSLSDSDYDFTEALYEKGIKGYFDAFSVHPYAQDRSPLAGDLESDRWSFADGVPRVHEVMKKHGDGDKSLWLTEYGWSTCDVRGQEHWQNCVDPSVQAKYLKQSFRQIAKWSYVPVGIWFTLKDWNDDRGNRTANHGLLRSDGSKKQSFWAFRSVARELREASPEPPPATNEPPPAKPPTGGPKQRRAVLRVARRHGVVSIRGRTRRRGLARLLVYRMNPRTGLFENRARYRWWFTSKRAGRFSLRLRGRALRTGTWRVVVRPHGHGRSFEAVLDG
jgi:hypothetical protein